MRNTIFAVITLAIFSLLSGEASAKSAQLQKHDAADIKSRCDAVGGKFSSTYFTYRCKTSTGTVKCSTISHNCKGYCDKCGTKGSEKLSIPDVLEPTNPSQCPADLRGRILRMSSCLPR
jgi:curli biogenesis system outer membrane secretion channel CsgG